MNTEDKISSLAAIRLGCWNVKVSTLTDQIIIIAFDQITGNFVMKVFYDELTAFNFLESEL